MFIHIFMIKAKEMQSSALLDYSQSFRRTHQVIGSSGKLWICISQTLLAAFLF